MRSGTVRKIASATNASVPSLPTSRWARISRGVVVVEQRVQPVAHGVLHRELLADHGHRARVAPHPVAQLQQALVEVGLQGAQPLVGVRGRRCRSPCRTAARRPPTPACGRCSRRCRRPCRWSCWRPRRRWCRPPRWPGPGRTCGRSGPAGRSAARTVTPGCTRTRSPSSRISMSRKCRRVSTSSSSVTAWPDRLVPPERKVSGTPRRPAQLEQPGHLGAAARGDDGAGQQQEVRGVVGLGVPGQLVVADLAGVGDGRPAARRAVVDARSRHHPGQNGGLQRRPAR